MTGGQTLLIDIDGMLGSASLVDVHGGSTIDGLILTIKTLGGEILTNCPRRWNFAVTDAVMAPSIFSEFIN